MLGAMGSPSPLANRVEAVRSFNRDYTRVSGLITEHLLDTPHSLTEARVIFELDADRELPQSELRSQIGLDPGYLSRVVSRLESSGLLRKRAAEDDARRQLLSLTTAGAELRGVLDRRSSDQVGTLLAGLGEQQQSRLVRAMSEISSTLIPPAEPGPVLLDGPRPGELGWVVERHGYLFNREYGWGPGFEALIAKVVAEFAERAPHAGEAAWIARVDEEPVGSVFCVAASKRTARLRLLLVEPHARGRRIGTLLVDRCIRFATEAGYEELVLWTMDVLVHARAIYEAAGFELTGSAPHRMFGPELVGQDWRLDLAGAPGR